MSGRIKDLQKQIHKILLKSMDDNQKRSTAIAHLHGVSLAAVMIAKKRGSSSTHFDIDLARSFSFQVKPYSVFF